MGERDLDANADGWPGPRCFDDFEVVRPLGQGGMGHVFLGHDVVLDRPVALKVTAAEDPSHVIRARFLREARAIARLSHPNVVGIYRVGEVSGRPYLAYEFVKGDDLSSLRVPMPWTRVVRIALGLARGLAAAHRAGVLHRDIKPSNAMLTPAGEVKLLDFGLARFADAETAATTPARTRASKPVIVDPVGQTQPLRGSQHHITNAGALLGTPAYMPPEIWRNETATERSDLYSLGLVLYELLTGTLPHRGVDDSINFESVLLLDPPAVRSKGIDVLPSLADLVDACIRREPADRPESADRLVESLERIVSLFVPASLAAVPLREDRDADLVSQSYERVVLRGDEITGRVYEKLFATRPDLRSLFPREMDAQRQKLAHALKLSIAGLGNHGGLLPLLHDLGRRHARFGLGADEYAALTDAVVATIRELDSKIDDEITHAWRRAFAFVTNTMRSAANSSDATHDEPVAPAALAAKADAAVSPMPSTRNATPPPERPPPTRYAFVEEHGIAYQVLGQGSPDLLLHFGRVSHLEHGWRHPKLADWLRALASMGRLVMLDKRGTGLSERVVAATNLQTRVEDPIAVLDAVETRRALFVGVGEGAATALLTAAFFPERVRGVVCINGSVRMLSAPGYPGGLDPAFLDRAIERIRTQWGDALFVESEAPSMKDDAEFAAWFGDYLRAATSPGTAIAQLKLNAAFDARWILPSIRVPVLVIHRADNRLIRAADGRYIADHVPGALYREVPGGDHLPFTGEVEPLLDAIQEFTWDPRLDAAPPPGLVVVALLRGDEGTDESVLARFTSRFEAVGARRIPHADENEILVAGPWFVSMAQVAAEIVATPAARSWGVRVALHAAVFEERDARERLMTALHDAVGAASAGECVLSEELQSICLRDQRPRGEAIVTSVGTRFG